MHYRLTNEISLALTSLSGYIRDGNGTTSVRAIFIFTGPGFIGFRDAVNITCNTRLALRFYEFSTRRQFRVPEIPRSITRRSYSHTPRGWHGGDDKDGNNFHSCCIRACNSPSHLPFLANSRWPLFPAANSTPDSLHFSRANLTSQIRVWDDSTDF